MQVLLMAVAVALSQPAPDRVELLERRVAELERRLMAKDVAAVPADERPLTYAEGVARAMRDGRPVVVWVGGEFCPQCVQDSAGDFHHVFVDSFPAASAPSIVVGVRDGSELVRLDVNWWITGDKEHGHIPSVRSAIRRWLDRRSGVASSGFSYQSSGMVMSSSMGYSSSMVSAKSTRVMVAPAVRVRSRSGCASCGG